MGDAVARQEGGPARAPERVVVAHRRHEELALARGHDRLGQERVLRERSQRGTADAERLDHRLLGAARAQAPRARLDLAAVAAVARDERLRVPEREGARLAERVEGTQLAGEGAGCEPELGELLAQAR